MSSESESDCGFDFSSELPDVPQTFAALSNSNRIPSDLELGILAQYRDECAAKLHEIESTMRALTQLRDFTQRRIQSHHSDFAAYVVRRLPDDVLGEIALKSVDSAGRVVPPWRMAAVCRRWRSALVGHAQLWTSLTGDTLEKLQLQLSRTAATLLHVRILPTVNPLQLVECLELLVPQSRRWASLQLDFQRERGRMHEAAAAIFSRCRGRLTQLTELTSIYWDPYPSLGDIFATAPRLARVSVYPGSTDFKLAWNHLTHYSFVVASSLDPFPFGSFLQSAQNLVHLAIGHGQYTQTPLPPVVFPSLQCLWIEAHYKVVIDAITAPALSSLVVEFEEINAYTELVLRSSPPLAHLVLDFSSNYRSPVADPTAKLLGLCSQLEYLMLYRAVPYDHDDDEANALDIDDLAALFGALKERALCPSLDHLIVGLRTYVSFRKMKKIEGQVLSSARRRKFIRRIERAKRKLRNAAFHMLQSRSPLRSGSLYISERDSALHSAALWANDKSQILSQDAIMKLMAAWRGFPADWPVWNSVDYGLSESESDMTCSRSEMEWDSDE